MEHGPVALDDAFETSPLGAGHELVPITVSQLVGDDVDDLYGSGHFVNDLDVNIAGFDNTHSISLLGFTFYDATGRALQPGSLVLIGSVNGMQALGHPAYSAAKAGLISYTKALAMEFGPFGIRANIVCPGTVKTPAWQARVDKNPQVLENLKKWYPLGDFATPDDVADAVLFLASSRARLITGVALPVDGGLSAGNRVLAHELTLEEF